MNTIYFTEPTTENIAAAADIIRRGGLLGIPTETVYGLGANALDEEAVLHIFEAKGRPQDNPLIIHVPDLSLIHIWALGDWARIIRPDYFAASRPGRR